MTEVSSNATTTSAELGGSPIPGVDPADVYNSLAGSSLFSRFLHRNCIGHFVVFVLMLAYLLFETLGGTAKTFLCHCAALCGYGRFETEEFLEGPYLESIDTT